MKPNKSQHFSSYRLVTKHTNQNTQLERFYCLFCNTMQDRDAKGGSILKQMGEDKLILPLWY